MAAAAPAITLVVVATGQLVLQDFPNSGDEYVYLYQAATLASGRLWNEPPPFPETFRFNYIVYDHNRAYGSFPMGWPMLLAMAMCLQIPVWLVNPLLAPASLALIARLGTNLYDSRVGFLAACMVGSSGFFVFNSASYFSHTLCGTLLLGAACLATRQDRSAAWVPLGLGCLLGWAVVTRYLTGVVCGIPIVLLFFRGQVSIRAAASLCIGGLPWAIGLLLYNNALTGSPWTLTTLPTTMSLWFREGFALRGADILSTHLLRFVLWTPPFLVAAYVCYLRWAPSGAGRGGLEWLPVIMAAVLYFFVERGGNQYGPRFFYEVFLFMTIFACANLFREREFAEKRPRDRVLFRLVAASVAVAPLLVARNALIEHRVITERTDLYTMAREAQLNNALVVVGDRVGTKRSMAAMDLTRNGTDLSNAILYGIDIGVAENCRVAEALGARQPYLYVWDARRAHGVLQMLRCAPQTTEAVPENVEDAQDR